MATGLEKAMSARHTRVIAILLRSLWLCLLCTPALAQNPTTTPTTTAETSGPPQHPALSAPLPGGVVEVAGGGGGFVTSCVPPNCPVAFVSPQPSVLLSLRWGINDNLQLTLPLIVTGSVRLADGPRLSLQGGLTGFSVSNATGVLLLSTVGAGCHFTGERAQLAFGVGARAFFGSTSQFRGLYGRAGFAFSLTSDLLLGSAVGVDVENGGFGVAGVRLTFTAGAQGPSPDVSAPLVRWWLLPWLSTELWPWLGATTAYNDDGTTLRIFAGGANASVTLTL